MKYEATWYNPQNNEYKDAGFKTVGEKLVFDQNENSDTVLKIAAK